MLTETEASDTTEDAVLGGRLRLRQLRRGHRFGHDAVLLGAATAAKTGDHVVDLGAGVGAAGLALVTRVPEITLTLVETDPALAQLGAENAQRNGLEHRTRVLTLDVTAPAQAFAAQGLAAGSVQHVVMNPPFNDAARQKRSPDAVRARAHSGGAEVLEAWCKTASRLLAWKGVLTLIWRADGLAEVVEVLSVGFGAIRVLPVHPDAYKPAIRIIVQATKASRAPLALLPGLVLNRADGSPTAETEAVLRDAAPLPLAI